VDREQDPSGDYGYDLAHEARGRPGPSGEAVARAERRRPPDAGAAADTDGDLGYDEAHGR
jgi:hypothetical protein